MHTYLQGQYIDVLVALCILKLIVVLLSEMSSAEIEAEIKKVLQISGPVVIQNSSKAFGTDTGSAQQESCVADVFSECRENTPNFTRQTLNTSKLDVKNSNQFHAVGYGRGRGCPTSDVIGDASSPKRRNRRKKKPGAVDGFQECPPGMTPDCNETRLQYDFSEPRVSSSDNQPNRKQDTANSFQNKKKEFPFRVSSSARENSKPGSNPTGASASTSHRPNTTIIEKPNIATAGQAGISGMKPGVVAASALVAQVGTGGVKLHLEATAVSVTQPCVTGLGLHTLTDTQTLGSVQKPVDKVSEGGNGGVKVPSVAKSPKPVAETDVKTVTTKTKESSAPGRQGVETSAAPSKG